MTDSSNLPFYLMLCMATDYVSNTEHEPLPKSRRIFLPFPHSKHCWRRKQGSNFLASALFPAKSRAVQSTGDTDLVPYSHCNGNQVCAAGLDGN